MQNILPPQPTWTAPWTTSLTTSLTASSTIPSTPTYKHPYLLKQHKMLETEQDWEKEIAK